MIPTPPALTPSTWGWTMGGGGEGAAPPKGRCYMRGGCISCLSPPWDPAPFGLNPTWGGSGWEDHVTCRSRCF